VYWLEHAKRHKTWAGAHHNILKPWAARKLSSIGKADIQGLHNRVSTSGTYAANRLLTGSGDVQ
jgi:hypothetical protein